jgi:hypothetical protein
VHLKASPPVLHIASRAVHQSTIIGSVIHRNRNCILSCLTGRTFLHVYREPVQLYIYFFLGGGAGGAGCEGGGVSSSVENFGMDHIINKLIVSELNSVHRMSRTEEPQFALKC